MIYTFAALRFSEDPNLSERVYWYLADEPYREGETVLAPVGARNRLQYAVVERTVRAEPQNAPYDMRLIKRVAARFEQRSFSAGGTVCRDMGGIRYDSKRYTRFGRLFYTEGLFAFTDEAKLILSDMGITQIVDADLPDGVCGAKPEGGVLLAGERAKDLARDVLLVLRGRKQNGGLESLAGRLV